MHTVPHAHSIMTSQQYQTFTVVRYTMTRQQARHVYDVIALTEPGDVRGMPPDVDILPISSFRRNNRAVGLRIFWPIWPKGRNKRQIKYVECQMPLSFIFSSEEYRPMDKLIPRDEFIKLAMEDLPFMEYVYH